MGAFGSIFSGKKGAGFQAAGADIANPVTEAEAKAANKQQQDFINALAAQNGIQNQSSVFNQLQNVASGQGPNPAQAQLAQATGNNIANQAALIASQRGAGQNIGLAARNAARIGGDLQQQAAGQGATLQAQQSLSALNQLGGIAGQQVGQQQQAINQNQNALLNSINAQNQANVGMVSNQNNANAAIAAQNAKTQGGLLGGLLGGVGSGFGLFAEGGEVNAPQQYSAIDPSEVPPITPVSAPPTSVVAPPAYKGKSKVGELLNSIVSGEDKSVDAGMALGQGIAGGIKSLFAQGGKVPALVSPGEIYLDRKDVKEIKDGKKSPMEGEKIKGKASVKGDSYKNDTVSKDLESGGIVLPRSVTQGKDAPEKAKQFVAAILAKQSIKRKK